MSAILPNGRSKTDAASRYEVGIQAKKIASNSNSFPIEGSAIFIADIVKGVIKDAIVITTNTAFLFRLFCMLLLDISLICSLLWFMSYYTAINCSNKHCNYENR